MKQDFKLANISEKAMELFRDTANVLRSSKNSRVRELASRIPTSFFDQTSKLTVVFAGQYSAGKSSILSLLTGCKQKVGQGVTTASTSYIDWNGITVIDTPGIHTQKHPDHDRITYEAISAADLIVFVLTNEGFSDHLGDHFRKLINEKGKGHEMMLVVNKMDDDAYGNTLESRKIKSQDINKVLSPNYSVEDMYISFISSDLHKESFSISDLEEKTEVEKESGWGEFIENLNRFTKDKRLAGKYTTNLYRLEQVIQDVLACYSTENPEADASIELLNRNRRALVECRHNIRERVKQEINKAGRDVIKVGDSVALSLTSSCKESDYNKLLEDAYKKADSISNDSLRTIEKIIGDETSKLSKALEVIQKSQLAQDLKNAIQKELKKRKLDPNVYKGAQKGAGYAKDFGSWLDKFAKAPNAKSGWSEIFKLGNYSGSNAHKVVLEIGHFFGHKFKPWEAVKIAGKIGKAGKFLGVAGAFVGVVFQIWNDCQESEVEENLQEARNDIRNGFREAANVIDLEFDKQTNCWVEKQLNPEIKNIDKAIDELEQLRKVEGMEYEKLKHLSLRVKQLIKEVQRDV